MQRTAVQPCTLTCHGRVTFVKYRIENDAHHQLGMPLQSNRNAITLEPVDIIRSTVEWIDDPSILTVTRRLATATNFRKIRINVLFAHKSVLRKLTQKYLSYRLLGGLVRFRNQISWTLLTYVEFSTPIQQHTTSRSCCLFTNCYKFMHYDKRRENLENFTGLLDYKGSSGTGNAGGAGGALDG